MRIHLKREGGALTGSLSPGIAGVRQLFLLPDAFGNLQHLPGDRIVERSGNRNLGADCLVMQVSYGRDQIFIQFLRKIP